MLKNAIVLGSLGQMGMLISRSLRESGIMVTQVDARPRNNVDGMPFLQSDVAAFESSLRTVIASADCLCVCLPETAALASASRLAEVMPSGSLWVDTLSVESGIVRALEPEAGRLQVLSINPMFAPVMGWAGGAVAVIDAAAGPKSAFFQKLLSLWGARLEVTGTEEHDRLTAAIQVATHAAVLSFGVTLLNLKVIWRVPCGFPRPLIACS
jgi:prephenate dehydrogenase